MLPQSLIKEHLLSVVVYLKSIGNHLTKKQTYVVLSFFVALLILGKSIYKDYGVPWDEPVQHTLGLHAYKYVFEGTPTFLTLSNRFHGVIYPLLLTHVEKTKGLTDYKDIIEMRHEINFLFFYIACIAFYFLNLKLFGSWKPALLAVLVFLLSPRIFADAFYNSKDLIFMDFFIISSLFAFKFLEKSNVLNSILLGVTSGISMAIRLPGAYIPLFVLLLALLRLKSRIKFLLTSLFVTSLTFYVCSPILWSDPINNLLLAYETMARFPQKTLTLYFGQQVSSLAVPWHYVLGWILVTTPLTYLVSFGIGVISLAKVRSSKFVFVLLWFLVPIFTASILRPNLYDSYRHLFFVYPALLIIAVVGIDTLFRHNQILVKYLLIIFVAIDMLSTLFFMVRYHPHQNVYFNSFAGMRRDIPRRFVMDYWGLSYKQSLHFLEKTVRTPVIKVKVKDYPGVANILMQDTPHRFQPVEDIALADFYITSYREEDFEMLKRYSEFYMVKVDGYAVNGIYKVH